MEYVNRDGRVRFFFYLFVHRLLTTRLVFLVVK